MIGKTRGKCGIRSADYRERVDERRSQTVTSTPRCYSDTCTHLHSSQASAHRSPARSTYPTVHCASSTPRRWWSSTATWRWRRCDATWGRQEAWRDDTTRSASSSAGSSWRWSPSCSRGRRSSEHQVPLQMSK